MSLARILIAAIVSTTVLTTGVGAIALADTSSADSAGAENTGIDENLTVEEIEEETDINFDELGIDLENKSVNLVELGEFADIDADALEGTELEEVESGGIGEEEEEQIQAGLCAAGLGGDGALESDVESTMEKNEDRDINRLPIQDAVDDCTTN